MPSSREQTLRWKKAYRARHRETLRLKSLEWWKTHTRKPKVRHPTKRMAYRSESYRDLTAYLRKRGNIHLHFRCVGGCYTWVIIYNDLTSICQTDRCVMIPLTIS